jgi:hypothetical protein
LSRASQAYSLFHRKPYDLKLRTEIKNICSSRFCPRKHAIIRVRALLDTQYIAAIIIERTYVSYSWRRRVMNSIINTKRKKDQILYLCACTIQCLIRCKFAYRKIQIETRIWARKAVAAIIVQKFIRWRNRQFLHIAWLVIERRRKFVRHAYETFRIVMAYQIRRKLQRNHANFAAKQAFLIKQERIRQYQIAITNRDNSVLKLQRFFKGCRARILALIASRTIRARRATGYSHTSTLLIKPFFKNYKSYFSKKGKNVGKLIEIWGKLKLKLKLKTSTKKVINNLRLLNFFTLFLPCTCTVLALALKFV